MIHSTGNGRAAARVCAEVRVRGRAAAIVCAALCAAALCARGDEGTAAEESAVRTFARMPPKLTGASSAAEVLAACRAMLPEKPVELRGALILRNRRGIVAKEYGYSLVLRREPDIALMKIGLTPRGATNLLVEADVARRPGVTPTVTVTYHDAAEGEAARTKPGLPEARPRRSAALPEAAATKRGPPEAAPVVNLSERILGTDVTWLDLTFEFLWWTDAAYEAAREGESVHGQTCSVILVKPPAPVEGISAVRLWVDKKTGCLMQAEQVGADGTPVRRLWGTRVKKFGERWMASVLEVETRGARHRTKITVESLKEL